MTEDFKPTHQSTRSYEEWKLSLLSLIANKNPTNKVIIENDKIKPYYDQGLMPAVAFKELFNK